MNKQILEFKTHLTDDSRHPGIVGRFTAIHTLPMVHPSEKAGDTLRLCFQISCLTPSHTKSMIASQLFFPYP